MNKEYVKIANLLENALFDAKAGLDSNPAKLNEEIMIFESLTNALEALKGAINKVRYYNLPFKEGLIEVRNDVVVLRNVESNIPIAYMTEGSRIEILDENWFSGTIGLRIQDETEEIYLYCDELSHPVLETGMKARIKIGSY